MCSLVLVLSFPLSAETVACWAENMRSPSSFSEDPANPFQKRSWAMKVKTNVQSGAGPVFSVLG